MFTAFWTDSQYGLKWPRERHLGVAKTASDCFPFSNYLLKLVINNLLLVKVVGFHLQCLQ